MLLPALLTLHWALAPGAADAGCSDLRHVENGRTFFRYGGLYVTFSCNPGFRIHGYRTSSCVSGQWVREPPLCVAPGCARPSGLLHGSAVVSPDGTLVRFSCDGGFSLFGSALLYCNGERWNGSVPVCRESDIMSSFWLKQTSLYRPGPQHNPDILTSQRSHSDTGSVTAAEQTLPNPSPIRESRPKVFLSRELAKSPQEHPEKNPLKKLWIGKATTQSRGESAEVTKTNAKLDTSQEHARRADVLPRLAPVSSPTVLMSISPATLSTKPAESITPVTPVTNEQKRQTSSSLLDQMFPPTPTDGEEETPLAPTTLRPHSDLSTPAATGQNMGLTSAYPLSDIFNATASHKGSWEVTSAGSQEILKEAPSFDMKKSQYKTTTQKERTPLPVSSPEPVVSGHEYLLESQKPFTVSSPPFVTAVMHVGANLPRRAPAAGAEEDVLLSTEVPTVATRLGSALPMTGSPDVTVIDTYLQMTKVTKEQTTVREDSTESLDPHTSLVGHIDGEFNDTILSASVLAHPQRNRTLETSTQSQENVESPRLAGKQVPGPPDWSSLPFTAPEIPAFPVRTRRPVCPYPPFPAHGTFYFRTIVNPGPFQYKHYIQYACYPGYTLANGDVYSYCLHDGQWNGATPMCIEVTPCSLNNGGCSQVCRLSQDKRVECVCQPGFLLLQDHHTCRDLDECVEGLHRCQQVCENTLGSYRCSCSHGFQLSADRMSCYDVDECAVAEDRTGCAFGCVNTPGSFHCRCPPGHRPNGAGRCEGRQRTASHHNTHAFEFRVLCSMRCTV
ncbi:uncharacterized protein LOC143527873 [Brachyhypopomus gauderio]|uniref:uncharacterized protein LOC143527873 n=1 Tax=Brachyhypopomus gauderio TaxID=698409 RepID=UPI00404118A8